jgi:hypothetical protein
MATRGGYLDSRQLVVGDEIPERAGDVSLGLEKNARWRVVEVTTDGVLICLPAERVRDEPPTTEPPTKRRA